MRRRDSPSEMVWRSFGRKAVGMESGGSGSSGGTDDWRSTAERQRFPARWPKCAAEHYGPAGVWITDVRIAASGTQASGSESNSGDSGSQQSVPDAPSATSGQGADNNLRNLTRQVAPGKAPTPENDQDQVQAPPPPQTNAPNPDGPPQQEAPYIPKIAEEAKTVHDHPREYHCTCRCQ